MNIHAAILNAKIGSERKGAQEDTCTVFARALFDVLREQKIAARIYTASFFVLPTSKPSWYHSVVKVGDRFYDSMGEVNHEIIRVRSKIHRVVKSRLDMKPDHRDEIEEEFSELHSFLVKRLRAAFAQV